jgi:hypothetical protein
MNIPYSREVSSNIQQLNILYRASSIKERQPHASQCLSPQIAGTKSYEAGRRRDAQAGQGEQKIGEIEVSYAIVITYLCSSDRPRTESDNTRIYGH